jgi:hypothetical protein
MGESSAEMSESSAEIREPSAEICETTLCIPPAMPTQGRRSSPLAARASALLKRMRRAAPGDSQGLPAPDKRTALPPDTPTWQADLNRVQLSGRLACEPLLHNVGDHHVAELQLVRERCWRGAAGGVARAHSWHRLTAWEDLADYCGRLLHAGDRVYVEGQLRPIAGQVAGSPTTTYELLLERVILLSCAIPRGQEGLLPANPALTWPEQPW